MNDEWNRIFCNRMRDFRAQHLTPQGAIPISIKVRVTSGCFHREHSPHAYILIDKQLNETIMNDEIVLNEHESGPELLIFVAAATAGISLAKSIIDLIVVILKARAEGIKRGDHPTSPLELIVRRTNKDDGFKEEVVLRIGCKEAIDRMMIEKQLKKTISNLLNEEIKTKSNKSSKNIGGKSTVRPKGDK